MRTINAYHPLAHHFEALFHNAVTAILVTNQKGKIITANPYACKEFGYTKKELTGNAIELLIPSRFRKAHVQHHHNYLSNPVSKKMMKGKEMMAIKKNGKEIPVEITLSAYKYNQEQFVIAFINNVSERKKNEQQIQHLTNELQNKVQQRTKDLEQTVQELEQSHAFQEALVAHAGAMIITTDKKGIIQSFNPAAEKHLGYKAEEIIGKYTPALFHIPEEVAYKAKTISKEVGRKLKPGFETFVARAAEDKMIETEWLHRKKDGTIFPVSLIVTAIKDSNQKITGYIGIVVDISDRKKAEAEASSIRKLLNDVFTKYPDGSIAVLDNEFRYVYAGGELLKTLQLPMNNLTGQRFLPLLNDMQWHYVKEQLEKVIDGKHLTGVEVPELKKGLQLTMDAFPLHQPDERIENIVVIIQNVSELKRIEEELKKALQKEKELGELKSRFVSMASHEFRTPLSTILSSANLLERYTAAEDQPKRNKHIQYIISSVGMLTDTLNDFLSVGKIEEGKITIKLLDTDICKLIETVVDEMTPLLKNGQSIKSVHSGKAVITIDSSLLRHIVMNLLSNASKFSNEGNAVEISTSVKAHQFILKIKDCGIGISREDQKHLMERFFRGTNASNIQGTGLGLHIVARYATLLNGTITWKSELEKGSEFIVKFHLNQ
jgi:PAS domain S-box-containing protein